jgi:hypothetical protein
MDEFSEHDVLIEMNRLHQIRQDEWNHVKPYISMYQGKNVPQPYVPASDEDRRAEAVNNLREKHAKIKAEAKQEYDMWQHRFGLKGGYRKSRSSRLGGRPVRSSIKKSPKPKAKNNAVLANIIDNLCTGELNQSGEYQAIWTSVMSENDDSDLGKLSRMSYKKLESKYGMKRADKYPDGEVEVDAKRFKEECRKADLKILPTRAAKERSKKNNKN